MTQTIRMIVTDLDQTLLRSDKRVSEYTRLILSRCQRRGIHIVPATARPERATSQLGLDGLLSYVIANNGATIATGGRRIRNIPIADSTKRILIARFVGSPEISAMTVETGDFLYTDDVDHENWSFGAPWNPVVTDFSGPISLDVSKISVKSANLEAILRIAQDYPDVQLLPNTGEHWHQITNRAASKFSAIEYLCALTDIPLRDVVAFGDDYNDVLMLKNCGLGVAMENAVVEAKLAADALCETNDQDGVAKFLMKYVLSGA